MKRSKAIQIISDAICNYEIEKSLNTRLTIEEASEQLLKELEDLGMQPPGKQKLEETFDDDRWGREIPGTRRTILNWVHEWDEE